MKLECGPGPVRKAGEGASWRASCETFSPVRRTRASARPRRRRSGGRARGSAATLTACCRTVRQKRRSGALNARGATWGRLFSSPNNLFGGCAGAFAAPAAHPRGARRVTAYPQCLHSSFFSQPRAFMRPPAPEQSRGAASCPHRCADAAESVLALLVFARLPRRRAAPAAARGGSAPRLLLLLLPSLSGLVRRAGHVRQCLLA